MKTYFVESIVIAGLMCIGFGFLGSIRIRTPEPVKSVERPNSRTVSHLDTQSLIQQGEPIDRANPSDGFGISLTAVQQPKMSD